MAGFPLISSPTHADRSPMRARLYRNAGFTAIETLMVVALIGVLSAIAVPMIGGELGYLRLSGDARSASSALALVKLNAATKFTNARLFVDVNGRTHHMETWDTSTVPPHWQTEGGTTLLGTNVNFGYGVVTTAPNTQGAITLAAPCKVGDNSTAVIANTYCFIFNSRGIPVDAAGVPTPVNALYLTDGSAVYGITLAATGMMRSWRTLPAATPTWVLQ